MHIHGLPVLNKLWQGEFLMWSLQANPSDNQQNFVVTPNTVYTVHCDHLFKQVFTNIPTSGTTIAWKCSGNVIISLKVSLSCRTVTQMYIYIYIYTCKETQRCFKPIVDIIYVTAKQKPAMFIYKLKFILLPQLIAILNNYACLLPPLSTG